jgi:hypothetical protein
MKRQIVLSVGLLILFCPFTFAQYGIFDQVADWGGEEFPPQQGNMKIPGSVEVTGTGASASYVILGNGNDIWGTSDEGFFVYTNRSGSWRLSAKVYWEVPGPDAWAKAGIMMRENGADPASRHYWIELRGADFGDRVDAQWRPETGGESFGSDAINEEDGTTDVRDQGDGVYFRITRYAGINLVSSEYSYDGSEWFFAHSMTMEFPDEIAWGLAITSHTDDDFLSEATISEVVLEEVQEVVSVTRELDASSFVPGQTINVTLNLFNPTSEPLQTTFTETFPEAFTVSNISNGGSASGNTITWEYAAPSTDSTLSYQLTVPDDYDPSVLGYSAQWTGTTGSLEFVGDNFLFMITVGVGEELFSFDFEDADQVDQWTDLAGFWDIEGGLFYEWEDADGPLVTLTGDPTLTDVAVSVQGMGLVADADWGIVFRATDIGNFYSWQFVNGTLALLSYVNGTRSDPVLYSETYAEELNVWQDFMVIVKGNVIHCYFNGELKTIVEDDNLTAGQVGLFGWVNSGSTVEENGFIAFENFVVSTVGEPTGVADWSLY